MSLFDPRNDILESIRRVVIPPLGYLVQGINELTGLDLYAEGETHKNEFVGKVEMSEDEFEKELYNMGFERNPLASLKQLTRTDEVEEGSFRWVPRENSEHDSDFQLHVIIYDNSAYPNDSHDGIYVFAHWEYRWDRAPIKHYKGVDMDNAKGVRLMRAFLEEHNIYFANEYPE